MAAPRGGDGRPAGGRRRGTGVGAANLRATREWVCSVVVLIAGFVVVLVSMVMSDACLRLFSQIESTMFCCHVYTRGCDKRRVSVLAVLVAF